MFDIGWSELLIIGIVALIAIGPKELPGVLRAMGQWMGKVRRMAADFQSQFNEAMREAEMEDIRKQVDELTGAASSVTNFDPMSELNKQFETAIEDKPAKPAEKPDDAPAAAPDAAPVSESAPAPEPEPEPQPKVGSGA